MDKWRALAERYDTLTGEVRIVLVGKYTGMSDTYLSVIKALQHASVACNRKLVLEWIEAADLEPETKVSDPSKVWPCSLSWHGVQFVHTNHASLCGAGSTRSRGLSCAIVRAFLFPEVLAPAASRGRFSRRVGPGKIEFHTSASALGYKQLLLNTREMSSGGRMQIGKFNQCAP